MATGLNSVPAWHTESMYKLQGAAFGGQGEVLCYAQEYAPLNCCKTSAGQIQVGESEAVVKKTRACIAGP